MYKLYCKKLPVKRRIKSVYNGEGRKTFLSFVYMSSRSPSCPFGVFPAPAFVADFPPVAPEFHHRTHHVRLKNLGTTDKKSSHKIRHRKIPRENFPAKSGTESFRENIYGNVIFRWQIRLRNEAEKGEDTNMRKMGSDGQLKRMICNACGKKMAVKQGIVLEGVISVDHTWDYFSEKDGQTDHFDLCEECYDQMTAAFKIAVETEEQTEYL